MPKKYWFWKISYFLSLCIRNFYFHFFKMIFNDKETQHLKATPTPSLLCLIRAIARAHPSTIATSLIRVKNSTHHFSLTLIYWDIGMEKMIERSKTLNWTVNNFSLIFVKLNVSFSVVLPIWIGIRGKC